MCVIRGGRVLTERGNKRTPLDVHHSRNHLKVLLHSGHGLAGRLVCVECCTGMDGWSPLFPASTRIDGSAQGITSGRGSAGAPIATLGTAREVPTQLEKLAAEPLDTSKTQAAPATQAKLASEQALTVPVRS